jgi:hypothetical protein
MAPSYAKRHASERVCSLGAAKSFTVVDFGGVLSGAACSGLCDGPRAPRPLARNPKIDRQIDVDSRSRSRSRSASSRPLET